MFENNSITKQSESRQRLQAHLDHLKTLEENKENRVKWKESIRAKVIAWINRYGLEEVFLPQIDFLVTLPLAKISGIIKEEHTRVRKERAAIKLQAYFRMKIKSLKFKFRKSLVIHSVLTIQRIWRALCIFKYKKS